MSDYLARLNPEQRRAVETVDGPLLVLAGAGTGKTRVLTTRFAHILLTGRAHPGQVLAVTFTNKAAREMRERVGALLGHPAEGMWLGTFHALCARMLRRHADLVGLTSGFTILDSDDQLRLLKQVMEAHHVDAKRWAPPGLMGVIQRWKDRGLTPARVGPSEDTEFAGGRALELYSAYQARLAELNTADFGDLLLHMTEILRTREEVLAQYHRMFRYILVDEYQDTNVVQYLWLRLLARSHGNICCVGDDDQCLAAGTAVTMADGTQRPIETIRPGQEVRACYGFGEFRSARVTEVFERQCRRSLVRLRLADGRELVSTPEHVHFADVLLGESPQRFYTYLMRRGRQHRIGTSQIYTQGQVHPIIGFKQRCVQEHADAVWLISAFDNENDARECEHILSLRYGVTTLPFVARMGGSSNGMVHDQARLDRIHTTLSGQDGAERLMRDHGLDADHAHHTPQTTRGRRRNLILTLFADRRGLRPMHRVSMSGNDDEGRDAVRAAGLNPRPYARNPANWRYESAFGSVGDVERIRARLEPHMPVTVVRKANLLGKALTLRPAAQVRPGMIMAGEDGQYHAVVAVERIEADTSVHDLNVEDVHNFVANGVVTHNSIYSWRGAEVENILRFDKDFPGAQVVKLESNYRSTAPILAAAAGLIAHNEGRLGKTLRPGGNDAAGERVQVFGLYDSNEEARMVGERVETLHRDGHRLAEMAILVRAGFQTRSFEERMLTLAIPYRVVGGLRFYERAEIRDAVAYMRVLHQPSDDLAFERIVNVPRRGVGDGAMRTMHAHARARRIPLAAAAAELVGNGGLKGRVREGVGALLRLFAGLREALPRDGHVVVLQALLDESGYMEMWRQDRSVEAPGRIENLKELVQAVSDFETLAGFLDHVSLVMENEQDAEADRISLMTLHAAKGLEFDTVFLPGWEEGTFPNQRSLDESGNKALEEERRLAYVGITRARRRVVVSHAANRLIYGSWTSTVPSRFVDELPGEHVEVVNSAAMEREARLVAAPSVFSGGPLVARRPKVLDAWEQPGRPAQAAAIKPGERVFHQKFGYGTVTAVDDEKLDVDFDKAGSKRLLDRFVEKAQ